MNSTAHFTKCLESWYASNKRNFPWRENRDPYYIWVSEIMSHQTQIDRVAEKFFPRFIDRFPNIETLAKSEWEDIFPVWEGLGYYNRGKNMLKTAQIIVGEYNGKIPNEVEILETLPGIGKYTACAICSFAYDQKVPAVDTNISKIVSTLWPDKNTIDQAQALIDCAQSGFVWNSAMMDLATCLRFKKPIGGELETEFFPPEIAEKFIPQRRKPKPKKQKTSKGGRLIEVGIACIWQDGKYLIQSRPKGKSFVGFWEFPGGKRETGESFRECVKREIQEEIGVNISVRPHFYEEECTFKDNDTRLLLRFHRCKIQAGEPKALEKQELKWIKPEDFFKNTKFLATNHKALKVLQKMRV